MNIILLQKSLFIIATILCVGHTQAQQALPLLSKSYNSDSIPVAEEDNYTIEWEVIAEGDTIFHYIRQPFNYGELYSGISESTPDNDIFQTENFIGGEEITIVEEAALLDGYKSAVGQIPFSEATTPSGGKTYSIPIMTASVNSAVPQIAITYNSQAGNGVAGFGWNIAGVSAITGAGKSIYYDGVTAPAGSFSPFGSALALDGVRLVEYEGAKNTPPVIEPEIPVEDYYDYETAQGFILVKRTSPPTSAARFTASYPNGSTAIFGFNEPTQTPLYHMYPVTEITDPKGNKIHFTYIISGNNYYISKISYGGKTPETHQGEIEFIYEDRTDFTTTYFTDTPLSSNKLLKTVISKSKVNGIFEELCTYKLTHEMSNVNRLKRVDCLSGNSSLNPLVFAYQYYQDNEEGYLKKDVSMQISQYFPLETASPLFKRGKFLKNKYGDGLITYPGNYSTYAKIGKRVISSDSVSMERVLFGSGYPTNQNILIAPIISSFSSVDSIYTEAGFQTIDAVDIDGDGFDELVKVNFNGVSGSNTRLKITVYNVSENAHAISLRYTFNVLVAGTFQKASPLPRAFYFGDFNGNEKAQLLTISFNKNPNNEDNISQFALIDLEHKYKISETPLFSFGAEDTHYLLPLDINGDGKTELCFITPSATDVYGLSGSNSFTKFHSSTTLSRRYLNLNKRGKLLVGDLNADGKPDLLFSPQPSSYTTITKNFPVWYPRLCPYCERADPLALDFGYLQHCKYCDRDLWEYYANNPQEAKCRECASQLAHCPEEDKTNTKSAEMDFSYCCPEHGEMVLSQANIEVEYNGNIWHAFIPTGNGFTIQKMKIITRQYDDRTSLMDINGDGCAELIYAKNGVMMPYMNINGTISSNPGIAVSVSEKPGILPYNTVNYYSASHFIAINNGDIERYSFTKDNAKANLLTSLTDSYGNQYVNRYSDMAEPIPNYEPTPTTYNYPYCSFMAPLNLIRISEINNRMGENIKYFHHYYYGAVMHRTGLGFCGFEKVKTSESVENIEVVETRDPLMRGVTTKVESKFKNASYSYVQDAFANRKNNPRMTYAAETDLLTGVSSYAWYEYDPYNNPTRITQHAGSAVSSITTQTYENMVWTGLYLTGLPRVKTVTTSRGGTSWTDKEEIAYYPATNLPDTRVTYTGVSGNLKTGETRWEYDDNGNVISEKSAPYNATLFRGTTYAYTPDGRYLTVSTNAFGQGTTYADFDKYGTPRVVTDHKGRSVTRVFDTWGRLVSVTHPDGVVEKTTATWGGIGRYTVTNTMTGKPTSITHYDADGREVRSGSQRFDGGWIFTDKLYDERGRLDKTSLPFKGGASPAYWNTYTYDDYNRPTRVEEASGKTTTWQYNGLSVTETRNGMPTTKTTDASGALISVDDPGGTIIYHLRADGQPAKITAPGNVTTTFGYDAYGRQSSISDPSAGTQTFAESYAADGSLTRAVTDARGQTITTLYDSYGRLNVVQRPEFNTAYAYTESTLLLSETSGNGTSKNFTYDAYDRPATIRETAPDGKWLQKSFTYAAGNIASIQYTSQNENIGTESFVYANGHNTEIKFNGASIWKLTEENALGQPAKAATGALTRTYSYTAYGMPTGRTAGNIQNFSYSFDVQKGNLLSRADHTRGKTETFGYDNLNRLTGIGSRQIGYAANGNITQMPGVGTMAYEKQDRPYQVTLLTPTGTAVPLREQSVTYTSFQRPQSIAENGITATFAYNAAGDRVKMRVARGNQTILTRYYLGGQYEIDVERETSRDNIQRLYLGGDAYSAPAVFVKEANVWKMYYICRDYLGSITHIANADGSLKQELSYDAWGRLRNPATQVAYAAGSEPALFLGRGYTGHEHLPWFGLVNMNARLYDPVLGRFLSPDPYVQMPDFTQNFNRYSYCVNNPLVYVDKDGEFFWIPIIIGAVIGAYTGGVIANDGQFNPGKWDYSSGKTWGYMIGGAVVGGISGAVGGVVAGSGMPMANTVGIMSSSFVNSVGTHMYTGGQTPVSISFGIGSYDITNNKWGFLGKKGNSALENIGYGLGAMANLGDLGKIGNLLLNTEKKDVINHSAILDENGNRIISQGPGKNWIEPKGTVDHYLNRFLGGSGATNEYPIHGDNMIIKNVNITTIKNYGKALDFLTQRGGGVLPYSFLYSSCSTHTGLALNLAGIPTLFIHPYTVQASVWLWNAGITPALINNSYRLQNW